MGEIGIGAGPLLEARHLPHRPPVKNRYGRVVGEVRARFRFEPQR